MLRAPKHTYVASNRPDLSPKCAAIVDGLLRVLQVVDNDVKEMDGQDEQTVLERAAIAETKHGSLRRQDYVNLVVGLLRAKAGERTEQDFRKLLLEWLKGPPRTVVEERRVSAALEAAARHGKIPKHLRRMYFKRRRRNVSR